MGNQRIRTRKYYALRISLDSPLCVSGGQSENTDSDVLVNGKGEVFVPGTSLAGAMRNYLELDKKTRGIFGYSDGDDGRMSSVFVSDLYFDRTVVSVRDGVALSAGKTVENKFDMQIIETGASGTVFLNYIVREGDSEDLFERDITDIFLALQNGTIRIGANKNRGFGRIRVETVFQRKFSCEADGFDVDEWLDFLRNEKNLSCYTTQEAFEQWACKQTAHTAEKYIRIRVPLRLTGGISIRKYSARPQMADFEHITCNGSPVIPGSSWNGAIRADVRDILLSLGMTESDAAKKLKIWFGSVGKGKAKKRPAIRENGTGTSDENRGAEPEESQSRVVIGESVISGAVCLPMTRNRINRFDASTKDGALYSEIAYFGGRTDLEIMVRKDDAKKEEDTAYHALLAVLDMVINDIRGGYVPVGGQVAVGRGIFAADDEKEVLYSEEVSMDRCREELYSLAAGQ